MLSLYLVEESQSVNDRFPVELCWKYKIIGMWMRTFILGKFRLRYYSCVCARMPWLTQFLFCLYGVHRAPGDKLLSCFWAWESEPKPIHYPGSWLRDHIHIRAVTSSDCVCRGRCNRNTNQERFAKVSKTDLCETCPSTLSSSHME